jgi:hypothetical protein
VSKILSESAFDEILLALPSVRLRANLLTHNVTLEHELRSLREEVKKLQDTKATVVNWLREVNAADTVRAQYGRKLADRIEAGEYECPK